MVFAIDFDGTIVVNKFPAIGAEITHTTNFIRKYIQSNPHNQWVLWTMREGEVLRNALDWLEDHGLKPDAVNDNVKQLQEEWGNNPRKVYADFYIDDHNFTIPIEVKSETFTPDDPVVMVKPTKNVKTITELAKEVPTKNYPSYLDCPKPQHALAKADAVNHPKHYTDTPFGLEVIEITDKYDFSVGNALKYILRAGKKNDAVEDLEKAVWYLNHKIEMMKKNGSTVL